MESPKPNSLSPGLTAREIAERKASPPQIAFGISRPGFRVLYVAVLGLVHALVLATYWMAPQLSTTLGPNIITFDSGAAYIAPLPFAMSFPYRIGSDYAAVASSQLRMLENGKPLGPAHSPHASIREHGGGRYSHWGDAVWFSATDSSDPRTNGRSYAVMTVASVSPVVPFSLCVLDLLVFIFARDQIFRLYREHARGLLIAGISFINLAAAGIALGAFGSITAAQPAESKNVALVLATALHAFLGVGLVVLHWLPGMGLARFLFRCSSAAELLLIGFPVGMVLTAAAVAIALVIPYGSPLAALLLLACTLGLLGWRPMVEELFGILRTVIAALPFALGFGCWLALLWHGPTQTLAGSPSGDLVYYATSIDSLSFSPFPHLNLGYERAPSHNYFNMLFPAIGAAFSRVLPIEPFLFILAAGGTFFILSLTLCLNAFATGSGSSSSTRDYFFACGALWLAVVAANRYPYWPAESIPVIYTGPLTMAVAYCASLPGTRARFAAVAFAAVGSCLSKVVTLSILGPFALASILPRFSKLTRMGRLLTIAVTIFVTSYGLVLLTRFGRQLFGAGVSLGPTSLTLISQSQVPFAALIPWLLKDLAVVLLGISAFLVSTPFTAAAIALGFSAFLLHPFLFNANYVCGVLLLGLLAYQFPPPSGAARVLIVVGLAMAVPAALGTDPAGWSSGIVWLVAVGGAAGLVLKREQSLTFTTWISVGCALALCFALVAVGRGLILVSSGWHVGQPELTPAVREIWLKVRNWAPRDALIFTDQVSLEPRLLGGWNTYAITGQRQVFVSSLYTNGTARENPKQTAEDLKDNESVLTGAVAPDQLRLRGRYSAYFAVVSANRVVPGGWRRVFANDLYALYQVLPSQ